MNLLIKQLKTTVFYLGVFCLFMLTSCGGGGGGSSAGGGSDPVPGPSSAKEITSYKVNSIMADINQREKTISFTLPYGTDITNLKISFTTTGATVSVGNVKHQADRAGAVALTGDFSSPVVYKVIARDGTTNDYTATATIALKTDKAITHYTLSDLPAYTGAIDEASGKIALILPYGTDLTSHKVKFKTTGEKVAALINGVAVDQVSDDEGTGTTIDLTNPVTYIVTAADGSTKSYIVSVNMAQKTDKSITRYAVSNFENYPVSIDEENGRIILTLPYNTNLTNHKIKFKTTGEKITALINGVEVVQVSNDEGNGTTIDLTNPVVYTVTAADGSTKNYTVITEIVRNTAKSITYYAVSGFETRHVSIDEENGNISLSLPYNTNLTNHKIKFKTTGVKITALINGVDVEQISDDEGNGTIIDLTNPVTYTVTAGDGTIKRYTVTVKMDPSTEKAITSYQVSGIADHAVSIDDASGSIMLRLPYKTDLKNRKINFKFTGVKITALVNGEEIPQVSNDNGAGTEIDLTNPVVYIVTAADGSIKKYTVTVELGASTEKSITQYIIKGHENYPAAINEESGIIKLVLPYNTVLNNLRINFKMTGVKITARINDVDVPQVSDDNGDGTTIDLTNPVIYTVTAADGSTKNYTVITEIVRNTAKSITYYAASGFLDYPSEINEESGSIKLILPYNTVLNNLRINFKITGVKITARINDIDVPQVSDDNGDGTIIDLTNPVIYTVTAADGSTKSYNVEARTAPSYEKEILSYSINSIEGKIEGNTISVTLPFWVNLKEAVAKFNSVGKVTVNGAPQRS
ncbi:MAG: xynA1 3, partial [Burkholderiales bacterium]|nr:xynA1 3 [Burkholderiales bacterium]